MFPQLPLAAYVIPRRRRQTISVKVLFPGFMARALHDSRRSYSIVTANGLSGVVDFQTTNIMDIPFVLGVDAIRAVRASPIAEERGFSFGGGRPPRPRRALGDRSL